MNVFDKAIVVLFVYMFACADHIELDAQVSASYSLGKVVQSDRGR